jgi:hypothetical protein
MNPVLGTLHQITLTNVKSLTSVIQATATYPRTDDQSQRPHS